MLIPEIELFDLLLSSFYFILILLVAISIKRKITNQTIKKYFLPFVVYKLIMGVVFVMIHVLYYKGGDTFVYFMGSKFFVDISMSNPENIFNYYFSSYENLSNITITENYKALYFLNAKDMLFMSKITSFFTLLGFKYYLATSILFTAFCSIGIWLIFITFCKLYPSLHKYFAMGTLFYPTIAIWGSGILKDPLTLSSIGIFFFATHQLIKRRKLILSIFLITLSIYICLPLKPYVLYLFIPSMLIWTQSNIQSSINNSVIKLFVTPIIFLIIGFGGYLLINEISSEAGKYSLENIESVAKGFHSWHNYLAETRDQSGYTLGEINYTLSGILSKIPESIFVTFFRPFLFIETNNVPTFFEGIQSFILLIVSLFCIFKAGLFKTLKICLTNKNVFAFLFFSLSFGFAVGFTSYNFGALSRYKIPALPFYTASLAILLFESKKSRKGYFVDTNKKTTF